MKNSLIIEEIIVHLTVIILAQENTKYRMVQLICHNNMLKQVLLENKKQENEIVNTFTLKFLNVRKRKSQLYTSTEECKAQKKANDSLQQESTYAKAYLTTKGSERQAKFIKANSGTYHGLVQDRKSQ